MCCAVCITKYVYVVEKTNYINDFLSFLQLALYNIGLFYSDNDIFEWHVLYIYRVKWPISKDEMNYDS